MTHTNPGSNPFLSFKQQWTVLFIIASVMYLPFINQAINIDSDMFMHVTKQLCVNPVNPPLGEYGRHMILHDHTDMPASSVYKRCAHPPLLPLLFTPEYRLFGDTEWAFHAGMFIFYLAAIFGVWFLFGLFMDSRFRFNATLLWTFCPALVVNSHTIMWDVPITAIMIWSLYFAFLSNRLDRFWYVFFAAAITGIAAVVKTNCIALYIVIPFLYIVEKKWKYVAVFVLVSSLLPILWIVHNILIYEKIQYLAMGLFHPIPGDVRYRLERTVSYLGTVVTLPFFWFWLMAKIRHQKAVIIFAASISGIWGMLLVSMLHKPIVFGVAYAICTFAGLYALFYGLFFAKLFKYKTIRSSEAICISLYCIGYMLLIMSFPSASVRYMLPIVPVAVLVFAMLSGHLLEKGRRYFWIIVLVSTGLLSVSLSIADYMLCESDRKLPATLLSKGYESGKTWYFGRLAFDYYMYKAGYKNLKTEKQTPVSGDYLVQEILPPGYNATLFVPSTLKCEKPDTISFFKFPVRTMGIWAGFYGSDRLAYWINLHEWQRQYVVYTLR